MYIVDGNEIPEEDVNRSIADDIIDRMNHCRQLAKEAVKALNKEPHYRIEYCVDDIEEYVDYVPLSESEIKEIRELLEEQYLDEETPDEEKTGLLDVCAYGDYKQFDHLLPEYDELPWHCESCYLTYIDLDDVRYDFDFELVSVEEEGNMPKPRSTVPLKEDFFVELLAYKLFDENFVFSDLYYFKRDYFNRIFSIFWSFNTNKTIILSEVNKIAATIDRSSIKPLFVNDNPITDFVYSFFFSKWKEQGIEEWLVKLVEKMKAAWKDSLRY